jgi:hypothetical protein
MKEMTMRTIMTTVVVLASMATAGIAIAGRPNEARYPNLVKSWEALQGARNHLQRAEEAHLKHGTLGGHGVKAVDAVNAAQAEIDLAVAFADQHRRPGQPGVVTPKPPLVQRPDDAKYPNLGDARLEIEWAVRHIEDAMQYHAPIGTLGGHGEKAVDAARRALHEVGEAERWADAHGK